MTRTTGLRGRPRGLRIHADRLRHARQSRQLTQSALADAANVTLRTMQRAEADGSASSATIQAMCEVLGLSLTALVRTSTTDVRGALRGAGLALPAQTAPWTGRTADARALDRALGQRGATIVLGATGVGKSSLVRQVLAARAERTDEVVIWLNVATTLASDDVRAVMRRVGRALGFEALMPARPGASLAEVGQSFRHHLGALKCTLVLDGLAQPQLAAHLWRADAKGQLVVTTARRHVAAALEGRRFDLGALSLAASRDVLHHFVLPARLAFDEDGTNRLLALAGGVPGALCLAGRFLRRECATSPSSCADRLGSALDSKVDYALAPGEVALVEPARGLLSGRTWDLLGALSVLGLAPLPMSWVAEVADCSPRQLEHYLSELHDAFFLRATAASDPHEAGLALDPRSAWLCPLLLDEDAADAAHQRTDTFLAAEIARQFRGGVTAGWGWYLQHEALISHRVNTLLKEAGLTGSIREVATPLEVPDLSEHRLADPLRAILGGLAGMLMSKPLPYAPRWLFAGLAVAGPAAGTLESARLCYAAGNWRARHRVANAADLIRWYSPFWEAMEAADRPATVAMTTSAAVTALLLAEPTLDARPWVERSYDSARRTEPPIDRAIALGAAATGFIYCRADAAVLRDAASVFGEALTLIDKTDALDDWTSSILAMNRATCLLQAGVDAVDELRAAVVAALATEPERLDTLRAILVAQAAYYGADVTPPGAPSATEHAQALWRRGSRDVTPVDQARVTAIVSTLSTAMVLRRTQPDHPLVMSGLVRLDCPAPELRAPTFGSHCHHHMVLVSLDAMAPLVA